MPAFTEDQERDIARRYWGIKKLGTVEDLCRELGISKPTLLRIARDHPLTEKATPSDKGRRHSSDAA